MQERGTMQENRGRKKGTLQKCRLGRWVPCRKKFGRGLRVQHYREKKIGGNGLETLGQHQSFACVF